MLNIKHLTLVLTLLFGIHPILAQNAPIYFSRFNENKNKSIKYPMDIEMDKEYRYWISSFNGLIEYDGSKTRTYRMPFMENGALGSDHLFKLKFENDSILWISHLSGISRFNIRNHRFELVPIEGVSMSINYFFSGTFIDSRNEVFFVATGIGLLYYDRNLKHVRKFDEINKAIKGEVQRIHEADKRHYLICSTNGLFLFDKITKKIIKPEQLPASWKWINKTEFNGKIDDYCRVKDNIFLSLHYNSNDKYSVVIYNEKTDAITPLALKSNKGRYLFADSFNRIWMYGYGDKTEIYDIRTGKILEVDNSKSESTEEGFTICYSLYEDHENTIRMCTNSGLLTYHLYQNDFNVLSKNLPNNIYSEITQIEKDKIWFGSLYNGIYEYDLRTKKFENYNLSAIGKNKAFNDIWQIYAPENKELIWILHTNGLLTQYQRKHKAFKCISDTAFRGEQLSIAKDDNDRIYLITISGRVFLYNPLSQTFEYKLNVIDKLNIDDGVEINDAMGFGNGKILLATSGEGILEVDMTRNTCRANKVRTDKPEGLRSNIINILFRYNDSLAFAGTTNGISQFNLKTGDIVNYHYSGDDNLGYVYDIEKDAEGNLLFIGAFEIYRLNWKTKDIIDLGAKSNINETSCTDIFYSTNHRLLYALSEESVIEVKLNEEKLQPNIKPIIHEIISFDKTYAVGNKDLVKLEKTSNSFRVIFGSSTHRYNDDIEFYFAFNDDAYQPIYSNEVSFSNLRGGEHELRLKVVYKGNRTILAEKKLTIFLEKKFHQTTWFYILITLMSGGILYLVYRIRLNRVLAIERVRSKISRDLHDDIGSTLSTINILSGIVKAKIDKDPGSSKQYLEKISDYSQEMMDGMNDIVWSMNPGNDSMTKVIARMREFSRSILEPKGIEVNFQTEGNPELLKLNMEHRRDFYLIFKEALNNASKYSETKIIDIRIELKNNNIVLEIKDYGKGMDGDIKGGGNGILNMEKRAKTIGAELYINSIKDKGTSVKLNLRA